MYPVNRMFTITTEVDDDYLLVTLTYKSSTGLEFSFEPENAEAITDINIDDNGDFDTSRSGGTCCFRWSPNSLTFETSRYGDGNGGALTINVPNTPETMNSLKQCLLTWKEAVKNIPE